MSDYQEARAEVGALIDSADRDPDAIVGVRVGELRALLAGPPEPSEEEVAEAIGYYFGTLVSRNPQPDMSGDPRAKLQPHIRRRFDSAAREAAQAVQALYRSKTND